MFHINFYHMMHRLWDTSSWKLCDRYLICICISQRVNWNYPLQAIDTIPMKLQVNTEKSYWTIFKKMVFLKSPLIKLVLTCVVIGTHLCSDWNSPVYWLVLTCIFIGTHLCSDWNSPVYWLVLTCVVIGTHLCSDWYSPV